MYGVAVDSMVDELLKYENRLENARTKVSVVDVALPIIPPGVETPGILTQSPRNPKKIPRGAFAKRKASQIATQCYRVTFEVLVSSNLRVRYTIRQRVLGALRNLVGLLERHDVPVFALPRAESGDGVPVAHRDGPKGKRKTISAMTMAANLVSESDGSRKSDGSGRRSLEKLFSVRRIARSLTKLKRQRRRAQKNWRR